MEIVQLIYSSQASRPLSQDAFKEILASAEANNRALSITGLLLYSQGHFIQVIEGKRSNVRQLYDRIRRDDRHREIEQLLMHSVEERQFVSWRMGFIEIDQYSSLDLEKIKKLTWLCRSPSFNADKKRAIAEILESFRGQLSRSRDVQQGSVLLVEDNARIRELLNEILRSEWSEVTSVDNAEMAWRLLSGRRFDLLITDYKLPGKSGADLACDMQPNSELAKIPILMISGRGNETDITAAEMMGVDAFLSKPFTQAQLRTRIASAQDTRRRRTF